MPAKFKPLTAALNVSVGSRQGAGVSRTLAIIVMEETERDIARELQLESLSTGFDAFVASPKQALDLLPSYPEIRATVLVGSRRDDDPALNELLAHGESVHASLFELRDDKVTFGEGAQAGELSLRRRRQAA